MRSTEIKECEKHGETLHVKEARGYLRCKKCASEAVSKRRRKVKHKLVEHFGGKCKVCGYDRYEGALQFHHLEPGKKDFALSARGLTRSYEKCLAEAKKCLLVCGNCHAEIHAGLIEPQDFI